MAAPTTPRLPSGSEGPATCLSTGGSASLWVLGQVAGPPRTAKVLHAGRDAVYLDVAGSCLAVLSARAAQVPCGVRTTLPELPEVPPGAAVLVVDGSVELPGCEVLVTDLVDVTVPVLTPDAAAWGAQHLDALAAVDLIRVRAALPSDALVALGAGDADAVPALLGLGPGLTPLGDDVLCGWLATAVAGRHPSLDDVRSRTRLEATERTTTLSATLLGCASRGEGVPELRQLLSGIARRDRAAVEGAVDVLLGVGDTSGGGMVLGALVALEGLR